GKDAENWRADSIGRQKSKPGAFVLRDAGCQSSAVRTDETGSICNVPMAGLEDGEARIRVSIHTVIGNPALSVRKECGAKFPARLRLNNRGPSTRDNRCCFRRD